ncbi:MAG: serine hydrolase domain-containing protein [Christensenellales bacterium]|nr:serine hydrolase domain-containing protein [Christensenellales bacterium]
MNAQILLKKLLDEGLNEGCYPGAAAAFGMGDHVYAISCTGKISENGANVNEETRYDMASCSKIIGPTMIALRALEEGDLILSDSLERFFSECPEDKREITVRHLMAHTSGIAPAFWLERLTDDPGAAARVILERPLTAPIGERVQYSCMGYILLGSILERIYGKQLNVLAQERVFLPLGMKHTGYCPEGGNIAATEVDPITGRAFQGVVHDENARFLRGISGNAGIFSDIVDMTRFARMLAQGAKGYLSPATFKTAIRCHGEGYDARRGLGFHLAGTPGSFMGDMIPKEAFGHTGFTGTSVVIDPCSGFFAILLSNRVHPTRNNEKLFRFRRCFHNVLFAWVSQIESQ